MPLQEDQRPYPSLGALVGTLALFFTFLELVKTYRASSWAGLSAQDWAGVAVGCCVYAVLLGVMTWGIYAILHRVTRYMVSLRISSSEDAVHVLVSVGMPLSAAASAAILWFVLSIHREETPTLDDALVVLALSGFTFGAIVLPRLRFMSLRAVCGAGVTALAAGAVMLDGSSRLYFFAAERAQVSTVASVGWGAATALTGIAAWGFRNKPWTKTRRWSLSTLMVALPLALPYVSPVSNPAPQEPRKTNLILIVVDALRADYCSTYGGPCRTASLDAMARKGVLFRRCYSLASWTPPSMSGMFASVYPPGLAAGPTRKPWIEEIWKYSLRRNDTSLAELLAADGYGTCALVGNPLIPGMYGMLRGFETYAYSPPMLKRKTSLVRCCPFLQDVLAAWVPFLVETRFNDTTGELTRRASAYIRSHRNLPFFLWLHYIDPHSPYDPPDAYRTMSGPWRAFVPILNDMEWLEDRVHGYVLSDFAEQERPYVRSLYEGEVRYVDDSIGRIVRELARLGLENNTYVCVTADHGEEFWEHGGWGHGQTLYEELTHVPLLLVGPGLTRRTIEEPVSAIDLMPTLAELIGIAPAASWRGTSLAPVVRGEASAPSAAPCFARGTSPRVRTEPLEMVVVGECQLIRGVNTGAVELYNVRQNPDETRNLASEEPERVSHLTGLVDQWRTANPYDFDTFLNGNPVDSNREEVLQQFRAIGYL